MIQKKYYIKYSPAKKLYYIVCEEIFLWVFLVGRYDIRDCSPGRMDWPTLYFDSLDEARNQVEAQKRGDRLEKMRFR
jgi:hypothetical protein